MLFTKIRNFNSKKVLAFILAICVTFSIVQSTMMLSLANSSEKQMLHLSDGLSKVGLELSGDKVTVGTEYIIEFKYHFESGNLYTTSAEAVSSPNAMFHVFYQATTE
ncbi:MAG: hypothetical protein IKK55_00830, partial [Clostridia bacterium]|nr:hypothetical protein [Clostridia bacterium]